MEIRLILIIDVPRSPANGEYMYSSKQIKCHPMDFFICVYWVSYVSQTRQVIEKRFSASLKGVEK